MKIQYEGRRYEEIYNPKTGRYENKYVGTPSAVIFTKDYDLIKEVINGLIDRGWEFQGGFDGRTDDETGNYFKVNNQDDYNNFKDDYKEIKHSL